MQDTHTKIRIILADDHVHIHTLVATVLSVVDDIELVAQGSNGQDAVLLSQQFQPDIVLMDVVMPVMDGIEATRQLRQTHPDIKILVLSSFDDDDSVRAMIDGGAVGYIMKTSLAKDVVSTIRTVYFGHTVLASEVADVLLHPQLAEPMQKFGLTQRELEVLRLMAEGMNNGQIAASLTISISTVKFHIANILGKMGIETRAEAIVIAAKNSLL